MKFSLLQCVSSSGLAFGMFEVFSRMGPPTLGGPPFWTLKIPYKLTFQFERLWWLYYGANTDINDQKCCNQIRFASTQCSKMWLRRGSAPDPDGGAYSTPPDPLAGFKGTTSRRGGGERRDGSGKEGKERKERRRGVQLWCTVGTGSPIG